jgi:hypothetical protein
MRVDATSMVDPPGEEGVAVAVTRGIAGGATHAAKARTARTRTTDRATGAPWKACRHLDG